MSQSVPSWDLHDDNPKLNLPHSKLDYEVAELRWENGQLSMHGLSPPRVPITSPATSSHTKYTCKPRATGGTLESIVDQATFSHQKATAYSRYAGVDANAALNSAAATATMRMDALVPCTNNRNNGASMHVVDSGVGTCSWVECSTRVESATAAHEGSSGRDVQSMTRSTTLGRDSRKLTLDMCETEFEVGGFTSTSMGSPENISSRKQSTADNHVYVCHKRHQRETAGCEEAKKKSKAKSSISTKRVRAASIHNQSERKRRDKINQRMKTLQKLVPNSSKTDKVSMLDEVIEYLKQLQAQVNLASRMNMSPMMLPLAMQQQPQMPMMVPVTGPPMMGMGLNIMDMNTMGSGRPTLTGMPPVLHPMTAVISPLTPWEGTGGDRFHTPASVIPDPMSTFLAACQSQPMSIDAYGRIAMPLYQQLHQNTLHQNTGASINN